MICQVQQCYYKYKFKMYWGNNSNCGYNNQMEYFWMPVMNNVTYYQPQVYVVPSERQPRPLQNVQSKPEDIQQSEFIANEQPFNQDIKRRKEFKRFTNNSYKKFTVLARKELRKRLKPSQNKQFQQKFSKKKNQKTYFLIILAFAKHLFTIKDLQQFSTSLFASIKNKIQKYMIEIERSQNAKLKEYRENQIEDLKDSIDAAELYFQKNLQAAIQVLYKRSTTNASKRHCLLSSIKIMQEVEQSLNLNSEVSLPIQRQESFTKPIKGQERRIIEGKSQLYELQNNFHPLQQVQIKDNMKLQQQKPEINIQELMGSAFLEQLQSQKKVQKKTGQDLCESRPSYC